MQTAEEIDVLYTKIVNMGPISPDELKSIFLINALTDNHENLQSHLMSMIADDPSFSSKTIMYHFRQEDNLMRRRAEQNSQASSAFAAQGRRKPRPVCVNCKKPDHFVDFCILPGGKMAGRSIEDARAAQRSAAKPRPKQPASKIPAPVASSANAATTKTKATPANATSMSKTTPEAIVIGGITHYPAAPSARRWGGNAPSFVDTQK